MAAEILQHPSAPPATDAPPDEQTTDPTWIGDPELEVQIRELIVMLDYEVGRRWMSFGLRLQIEKLELLIGERGTAPTF